MNRAKPITDNDVVQPLHYYESRDVYHVPAFVTPGRLGWYRKHCDDDYYIRSLDAGVYEIGCMTSGRTPNARKMRVECPYEDGMILQAVDKTTMFCPSCAPHKYVRNGEVLKKQWRGSDGTRPNYFVAEDDADA